MKNVADLHVSVRRRVANAAVLLFLMTASAPVRAMTQLEGESESRIVYVHTDALHRRRRAIDRYYGLLTPRFAYPLY